MMKLIKTLSILLMAVFSSPLWATIVLTPADCNVGVNCWTSDINANPDADAIEGHVGTSTELFLLYKSDQGGADSGSWADWYDTTYENSASDPEDALIEWLGSAGDPYISCTECYLSVKDGNHAPSLYIFNLNLWDGQMAIDLNNFWPGGGAISNVAIWGPGSPVPAPSTLGLLGLSLIGLSMMRRRRLAR
jgi:hypothetical protein